MPRPNKPEEFSQINFLVNYFVQGCTPPAQLFLEFAKEPLADLAMLILLPDAEDIGQEVLDGKKGRTRKPGRHGRKRGRGLGLPDSSTLIASRLDRARVITNFVQITPLRWMLPLYNVYEGLAFTAALVEGFTGVFYEGVLGVVTVGEDNCTNLDFLRRTRPNMQTLGGPGVIQQPFNLNTIERVDGFVSTQAGCANFDRDSRVTLRTTIRPLRANSNWECYVSLKNQTTGEESLSSIVPGSRAGWTDRTVNIFQPKGETITWGISDWNGFFECINTEAIAYSVFNFPWDD